MVGVLGDQLRALAHGCQHKRELANLRQHRAGENGMAPGITQAAEHQCVQRVVDQQRGDQQAANQPEIGGDKVQIDHHANADKKKRHENDAEWLQTVVHPIGLARHAHQHARHKGAQGR